MWRLIPAYLILSLILVPYTKATAAEKIYQTREDFLATAFDGNPPRPKVLWLGSDARAEIKKILGHPYAGIRVRYWAYGHRTAWILEEIGKYKPITAGIVVTHGRIGLVKVLIYRESHGWEIRYPFFTNQFRDIRLSRDRGLSHGIDGISGATLSVNALTRLAKLALYLHERAVGER